MIKDGIVTTGTMNHFPKITRTKAFTLIELLVVIAIIALLLGVILPSLNKAKSLARRVVCSANINSINKSLMVYFLDNDDWLPGPNTSGRHVKYDYGHPPDYLSEIQVIQKCDWFSPLFGDTLALPSDSRERFIRISENDFRCPANKVKYFAEYHNPGGGGQLYPEGDYITSVKPYQLTSMSYNSPVAFHLVSGNNPKYAGNSDMARDTDASVKRVLLPENYLPKLQNVGVPSAKVFTMEGCRFRNGTSGLSINTDYYQDDGGNYMNFGPATNNSGDPYDFIDTKAPELTEDAEKYAYRHNQRMNLLFLDGHAESAQFEDTLHINYYWPKGSVIKQAQYTYDPTDKNGKIK